MRRLAILSVVVLAACSSSSHKSPTTSTSTTVAPTTSTTVAATTTSTTEPATTSVPVTSMVLVKFNGPPSPVECNAQTILVELDWEIRGATKSELSIDGSVFAQFPSGKHKGLEPLTCDTKAHVYTVKATASGGAASLKSSLTLKSKPPS
jgi:hypothetical protein